MNIIPMYCTICFHAVYLYVHVPNALFLHIGHTVSLPAVGLSSRSRCGARRGAACTLGANLGASRAPWRILSAFKSPKLASIHGIAFR